MVGPSILAISVLQEQKPIKKAQSRLARLLNAYFVEHPDQLAGVLGPGGENLGPGGENLGPGSGEGPRAGEKVGDGAEGVGD